MPDIKFRCPECSQKIVVDSSATGVRVDCPMCRSTLVIPATEWSTVTVAVRRELAVLAGSADALYAELEKRKAELDAAVAESVKLRTAAEEAQGEVEKVRAERENFRNASEKAAEDMKKLRGDLDALASERDGLRSAREQEPARDELTKKEVEELKASLATLQRERDEFSVKLAAMASLREQLAELTAERSKLAVSNSEAFHDADSLRAEVTSLQARHKQADAHAEEWKRQLTVAQRERDDLINKVRGAESLPAELDAARAESQQLRTQINEITRIFEAARHERDQSALLASEREKSLEKMTQAIETAKAEIGLLRGEKTTSAAERDRLKASADEFHEESSELQHRVDGLLDELHAREREVAEAKQAGEAANSQAAGYENELRQIRAQRDALAVRVVEKERESAILTEQVSEAIRISQEAAGRIDAAERIAHTAQEKARLNEDERTRLGEKLTKTAAEFGAMQEQGRQIRIEKEQSRSRVHDLEAQVEQSFDQLGSIEAERDTLKSELDAVKTGLERAKQHVSVLQARRDVMREEINRLRAKLGMPPDGPGV